MKKYRIYLFDFDGTILNTMPALDFVFSISYEQVGIKFDTKLTKEYACIPIDIGYIRLKGSMEDFDKFYSFIEKSLDFQESLERNSPYEETYEVLQYLKENHIVSGIVTSNKISHVHDVMKAMNIPIDNFNIYIGNKECKNFKPHPEPIFNALKALGYEGPLDEVVYVGDGINDTICANNAGVDAILVDRDEEFQDSDKYIRIHNLKELFE